MHSSGLNNLCAVAVSTTLYVCKHLNSLNKVGKMNTNYLIDFNEMKYYVVFAWKDVPFLFYFVLLWACGFPVFCL